MWGHICSSSVLYRMGRITWDQEIVTQTWTRVHHWASTTCMHTYNHNIHYSTLHLPPKRFFSLCPTLSGGLTVWPVFDCVSREFIELGNFILIILFNFFPICLLYWQPHKVFMISTIWPIGGLNNVQLWHCLLHNDSRNPLVRDPNCVIWLKQRQFLALWLSFVSVSP